ncbi:MAG TPA: hypothetical protein PKY59_26430 [Pyrinomonadaceae bacterium]|nr:hypothetical protein [Pyrinomonadaceae bacterium]
MQNNKLDPKQELDYLKPYLTATIDSSARHRRIVVMMVTVSILILGTFWNSVYFGWMNKRVEAFETSSLVLDSILLKRETDAQIAKLQKIKHLIGINKQNREKIKQLRSENNPKGKNEITNLETEIEKIDTEISNLKKTIDLVFDDESDTELSKIEENLALKSKEHDKFVIEKLPKVQEWLDIKTEKLFFDDMPKLEPWRKNFDRNFPSERIKKLKDSIDPVKNELVRVKTQNMFLIKIPFFGISFEVNDLGFLGGLTFVILLIWFRLSLWTEANNLEFIHLTVSDANIRFCYHYLAMQQILTIPPAFTKKIHFPSSRESINLEDAKPWKPIPKLLYLLPAIVQSTVFIYDVISYKYGVATSHGMTYFSLSITLLWLVIILIYTFLSFRLAQKLDRIWDSFAKSASDSPQKWLYNFANSEDLSTGNP